MNKREEEEINALAYQIRSVSAKAIMDITECSTTNSVGDETGCPPTLAECREPHYVIAALAKRIVAIICEAEDRKEM